MHLQPGVSHPSIYIDTNGQPSSLPDVEGSAAPRLAVQSPDPSVICEYSRGEGQSSSGKAVLGLRGGGEEGSGGCLEPGDLAEVRSGLHQERSPGVEEPGSEPSPVGAASMSAQPKRLWVREPRARFCKHQCCSVAGIIELCKLAFKEETFKIKSNHCGSQQNNFHVHGPCTVSSVCAEDPREDKGCGVPCSTGPAEPTAVGAGRCAGKAC